MRVSLVSRFRAVLAPNPGDAAAAKQGCGLGLEVSVSRQSQELTTSRLGLVSVSGYFMLVLVAHTGK